MIGDKRIFSPLQRIILFQIYSKFLFEGSHLVSWGVSDLEAKRLSVRLEIVFCIFPNRNYFSRNNLP